MKKALLSGILILSFGFYTWILKANTSNVPLSTTSNLAVQNQSPADSNQVASTPTPEPVIKPKSSRTTSHSSSTSNTRAQTVTRGQFRNDGTFTGDSVDAFYGNVQVSATILNGRLADVTFLDYPSDRRTSLEKSQMAMPILRTEAIESQSANVNIVSGATSTSEAFSQSLLSALAQANT